MWLSRQIKIVMQQNSTYHDTHSTDESQNHCCNIGRKSCNRQNWYIATESKWMVASGRERMDSREHTGPVGVTVPYTLTFVESYGAVYSVSVHIVTCKLSLRAFNMGKSGGKAGGHLLFLFHILLHCWRFDSEHLSLLQQNTPREEWGQGRGESCEHFWTGFQGWSLKLCATVGLDS